MRKLKSRYLISFLVVVMALILLAVMGGSAAAADDVWKAEFWNNKDLSGSPVLVRSDRTIDFNWGKARPAQGVR